MSDNISSSELELQLISTLNLQVYQFKGEHITRLIKKHHLPREHFLLILEIIQQTLMEISNNPLELNNFIFSGAIACLLVQQRNKEMGFPTVSGRKYCYPDNQRCAILIAMVAPRLLDSNGPAWSTLPIDPEGRAKQYEIEFFAISEITQNFFCRSYLPMENHVSGFLSIFAHTRLIGCSSMSEIRTLAKYALDQNMPKENALELTKIVSPLWRVCWRLTYLRFHAAKEVKANYSQQ